MKSHLFRFQKSWPLLAKTALAALLLFTLIGCSAEDRQAEVDQLTTENETLRTELDKATADLTAAEAKVKELEDELEAMREPPVEPSEAVPEPINITAPERTPAELLLGKWYWQEFQEEGWWSYIQVFVFDTGGTGTISQIYYIPEAEVATIPIVDGEYQEKNVDVSDKLSWTLDGDTLHIVIDNGETADLTYSAARQEITFYDRTYGREMPTGMEGYVERSLYTTDFEAKEAARRRRFLGTWYYDVLTWTFNEDGTGIWDIPRLGNQPAEKREFTYKVYDEDNLMLNIEWKDSSYWLLFPTFNADGSMSLRGVTQSDPVMKWTKTFDPNNCPLTEQIISNQMGVFTGSVFSDMLNNALGGD